VNAPGSEQQPVLRNAMLHPDAVRIGRSRLADARPQLQAADRSLAAAPAADALPAVDRHEQARELGHAEGLRQGTAEGLRQGREEGLRAGYEEGLEMARKEAEAQARHALEAELAKAMLPLQKRERQLQELLGAIETDVKGFWAAAEDEMVALCYETVCRVLGEAAITRQGLEAQVAQLLATAHAEGQVVLHLHPADALLLDEARAHDEPTLSPAQSLAWVADPQVALGGCMLHANGGTLDARLETVLAACKAGLLEARAISARVRQAQ
jgi:flagellar assembly protein FliH